MAINVQYKVPAALLQAERDKERRAFNRQLQLQQNQQNFQREMQDTAYARSLENRQFNADRQDAQQKAVWDRQDALREDERQYQQGRLADQHRYADWQQQRLWDRQDALRQEQTAEALQEQEYLKSEVSRQKLEQNFSYSDDQLRMLKEINGDMSNLMSMRDMLTPEQFKQARTNLLAQKMAIMPEVPIVRKTAQEQMQERIGTIDIGGVPTQCYINEKGNIEPLYNEQDSVGRKRLADMSNFLIKIRSDASNLGLKMLEAGMLKSKEELNTFIDEYTARSWDKTPYGQEEIAAKEKKESLKSHEARLRDDQQARRKAEAAKQNEVKEKVDSTLDKVLSKSKEANILNTPSWMFK